MNDDYYLSVLYLAQNSCLQTNSGVGLPFFQGYTGNAAMPARRIQHRHQAIIPSYKFNCCGNITEWGVDLSPAEENVTFDFDFQVWRPSPRVNETGCYSLVNSFIVESISISTEPVTDHVARVTPSPQDQLQFQPGDVLGFYVESNGTTTNIDNGVVLLNNGSHNNEVVWFGSVDTTTQPAQSGSCPYPVGTTGLLNSLTRAAPVISIRIATYSCSYTTTSDLLTPTSVPNPSSMSSNAAVVVGVAVPLTLFGIISVITIIVVIVLYLKVRKLHKVVVAISTGKRYLPSEDPSNSTPLYERPQIRSIDVTKNVAYSSSNVQTDYCNNSRKYA